MIDYEKEVKKVYPDAVCEKLGINTDFYRIVSDLYSYHSTMSHADTELEAWQSAYETLVKQGKINPNEQTIR